MYPVKSIAAMLRLKLSFTTVVLTFAFCLCASSVLAQPAGGTRYDVTNYRIEAQLNPDEHTLRAGADITLIPQDATRSIVFELNGSLKVDGVELKMYIQPTQNVCWKYQL